MYCSIQVDNPLRKSTLSDYYTDTQRGLSPYIYNTWSENQYVPAAVILNNFFMPQYPKEIDVSYIENLGKKIHYSRDFL